MHVMCHCLGRVRLVDPFMHRTLRSPPRPVSQSANDAKLRHKTKFSPILDLVWNSRSYRGTDTQSANHRRLDPSAPRHSRPSAPSRTRRHGIGPRTYCYQQSIDPTYHRTYRRFDCQPTWIKMPA